MTKANARRVTIRPGLRQGEAEHVNKHWRATFLDHLAESSNVTASAAVAGINPRRAYKIRREDPEFARAWLAALGEGYLHLEMEVVRRLREGDTKTAEDGKFDFANAIRLLAAHRVSAAGGAARGSSDVPEVSAAEVRASIDRKIEDIRKQIARQKALKANRA